MAPISNDLLSYFHHVGDSMCNSYTIKSTGGITSLEIEDVRDLPHIIKYLGTQYGLDLSDTAAAIREVEDERKRKEAEKSQRDRKEIVDRVNEESARLRGERRFVIGWLDEDEQVRIPLRKGTEFSDGRILLDSPSISPLDRTRYRSVEELDGEILRAYPQTPCTAIAYPEKQ